MVVSVCKSGKDFSSIPEKQYPGYEVTKSCNCHLNQSGRERSSKLPDLLKAEKRLRWKIAWRLLTKPLRATSPYDITMQLIEHLKGIHSEIILTRCLPTGCTCHKEETLKKLTSEERFNEILATVTAKQEQGCGDTRLAFWENLIKAGVVKPQKKSRRKKDDKS